MEDLTGRRDADAILDCAGAEDGLALGAAVLAREGALTCVGLMGQKVVLPLLPFTNGEKSYFGSFWGNYDDLAEVLRSRARDSSSTPLPRWPSTTSTTSWRKLARGDVVGRAVLVFD
ncbi:MAG: zinc-binding dehydrogenase [Mycobacterium sp.]